MLAGVCLGTWAGAGLMTGDGKWAVALLGIAALCHRRHDRLRSDAHCHKGALAWTLERCRHRTDYSRDRHVCDPRGALSASAWPRQGRSRASHGSGLQPCYPGIGRQSGGGLTDQPGAGAVRTRHAGDGRDRHVARPGAAPAAAAGAIQHLLLRRLVRAWPLPCRARHALAPLPANSGTARRGCARQGCGRDRTATANRCG
jgi:hypothetical protein